MDRHGHEDRPPLAWTAEPALLHHRRGTSGTTRVAPRISTRRPTTALLDNALFIRTLIENHGKIMDRYDPDKRIGMIVDEWGTWSDVEPGTNPRLPLPTEHPARRDGRRPVAEHLQQARRSGAHGQHRPDHQCAASGHPGPMGRGCCAPPPTMSSTCTRSIRTPRY